MVFGIFVLALSGRGGEPAPAPGVDQGKPAFQAADTNADGKITCAEMTEDISREAFAKMDKDHNQIITREEWAGADKDPGARERFDAMDKNKDGQVVYAEFLGAVRQSENVDQAFSGLDKNGDGTLAPDEYSGHPHFNLLSVRF